MLFKIAFQMIVSPMVFPFGPTEENNAAVSPLGRCMDDGKESVMPAYRFIT